MFPQGNREEESVALRAPGRSGSLLQQNWARWMRSGSVEAPGDICVGQLDLAVSCTGVGELVPCIGVLEIPPQACHLCWEVIVPVLLSHNLSKDDKKEVV